MSSPLVRELIDAGVHFGHRASRWNPKMGPFIYGKRNQIHIIDIRETLRGLLRAKKFLNQVVSEGGDVLFVGTKRQARDIVQKHAQRCNMHAVFERWLGGTLTNFRTIRSRLQRLEQLEALVVSPDWNSSYSKKMQSTLSRELEKIRKNLDGIRRMTRLPAALVVVDVRKEVNAVREAHSLGIPTVCLIDTDSDPDLANIPIPGNDDAMRAIEIILRELANTCEEAMKGRPAQPEHREEDFSADTGTRRRGRGRGDGPRGARGGPGGARGGRGGRRDGDGRPPAGLAAAAAAVDQTVATAEVAVASASEPAAAPLEGSQEASA